MTPKTLAAIIFLLIAAPVAAQPPPGASRNGWSLGVAVISSPEPYVDAENETLFVPALSITAGRFSFRGIAAACAPASPGTTRRTAPFWKVWRTG